MLGGRQGGKTRVFAGADPEKRNAFSTRCAWGDDFSRRFSRKDLESFLFYELVMMVAAEESGVFRLPRSIVAKRKEPFEVSEN